MKSKAPNEKKKKVKRRKPWKPRKPTNPLRHIEKTRLKIVHTHPGKEPEPEYKPAFPKPGKEIKIDNPNSENWKRKAANLWGEYIHRKYNKCLVGWDCQGALEAHHFVGKRNVLVCFDPDNGGLLCRWHHKESKDCSPHAGPVGFAEFLQEEQPEKAYYIIENQHSTGKPDFRADYHKLKKLLEEL